MKLSNDVLTILRLEDMLLLARLYEQHVSLFFLQRFNSTKNPSKSLDKEVVSNLAGISSHMYTRIPSPLPFLSNLIGAEHPSIGNWLDENIESKLFLEINNISKLPLIPFQSI